MERRIALVAIVVAVLVALGVAAYAYMAIAPRSHEQAYSPAAPHHARHHPMSPGHPLAGHGHCKPVHPVAKPPRHHGPRIVVSTEFRKHVLGILMSDNRTATLLKEGYNVTAIKPVIEGIVQGDGTVSLKAVKAVVLLREKSGNTRGAALVVVDLVSGKVVRIIEHQVTAWSQTG